LHHPPSFCYVLGSPVGHDAPGATGMKRAWGLAMIIKVTSDDLMTVSGSLQSGAGEIDSRLKTMQGQVQSLIESGWQGAASAQFGGLFQEWNQGAAQLNTALEGIAQLLSSASRTYSEAEQAITQSMQQ
jgi:WXG100 family type VII secretion target